MTVTATVKGGDRLARKLLSLIGPAAQERIRTVKDRKSVV